MTAESDQLEDLNVLEAWKNGDWTREDGNLIVSPKTYGAKIELPGKVSGPYRLIAIVEPLDPPSGLILGSRLGESRFVTLLNYAQGGQLLSALENVDGKNVGNFTTVDRPLFEMGRLSQVVLTVEDDSVSVAVDGALVVEWSGQPTELSLSDYWRTPDENALFLGTYDCRYRFHRLTLQTSK
ncbi:hypothetical protein KOR42_11710 [Thalassoglobus neptunius]|uniref:3-keto-disaccharide hydrolase domain-containing protein n=1 Tax=Thalassoglobus neptunius TaxID=1938619 RepID=A0A5C5X496_9PLAN|nr:hypothetical protein [Thalassoglobus neptunius]TWT57804.1 hypothetical protein KOR42_11710 [Thalassoglobus neptunius]